jgi:hypothetical protein
MDRELAAQLERMFSDLNRQSAAGALPEPGTLADLLSEYVVDSSPSTVVAVKPKVLTHFATAAVEMWLRSVHSFLISASLTDASPIWSAVAGYYSSHYSIRAFAHLLGVFQLFRKRRIVYLGKEAGHLVVRIERKHADHREHKFYWKYVSEHPQFASDPFFYAPSDDAPESDGAHRNKANYVDHIDRFPVFLPLNLEALERTVERISTVEFSSVPVPRADHFPDTLNVQFIAYHRIVKFRRLLDEIPGVKNRFWKVQRNPSWCPGAMTFSVVDPVFAALYARK